MSHLRYLRWTRKEGILIPSPHENVLHHRHANSSECCDLASGELIAHTKNGCFLFQRDLPLHPTFSHCITKILLLCAELQMLGTNTMPCIARMPNDFSLRHLSSMPPLPHLNVYICVLAVAVTVSTDST